MVDDSDHRVIEAIRLPVWGSVVASGDVVPWRLVDGLGEPVGPVEVFLRDFVAQGRSANSVRSYALALLRWWRFLVAVGVAWDRVTSAEVRDFVLWLGQAAKPVAAARVASRATVGQVNPVTRKRHLGDGYGPATVRHSNAVLRTFYEFWLERGEGPLVNPVVLARAARGRAHAHHNPLEVFRPEGRLRYNPRLPKRKPRAMPDEQWDALFAAMGRNRDRAILAVAVSTGARAAELLGMRGADLDWGEQLVQVVRKGTRAEQWLPASPEAFVWLRLYLADVGGGVLGSGDPVWRTVYRRGGVHEPLNYDALRAVFRRANGRLGANWTMHDLRHTCAIRMVRDGRLSLRDAQTILGHAHLSTTQLYLDQDDEEVFARVREHLAARERPRPAPPPAALGYDPADLAVLFGNPR
ncbi:site-specific recombinase XerD [Frankia torreyi]|uniref:Site-specific recombinase XerD n=2 Tax=Frankia TaxID=1854 RepID=A0A0D8BCH8_9ACTN|nr:tyrosine-type recombinase/integrase [Frankia torreyi]KJE21102.1 site-specific recombinase XerD [Frankia torreyi]KQM03630.1 site-specific recombinase XerD [Frankia sp. CpI1-P]